MQATFQQLFKHAYQAHQAGQLKTAISGYQAVLKLQPKLFEAWHLLGIATLQNGEYAGAAQAIERALQINDRDATAWQNLAAAYRSQHRYAEAAHCLAQRLALAPADAATLNTLAELQAMAGQHEGALRTLNQLAEASPQDPEVCVAQGVALRELHRPAEALACFDRALLLAPSHVRAANNRATALHEIGRHEEALQAFDALLAAEPRYAPAHNARALTLWHLKRLDEADSAYGRAIDCDANYAEAWANRGALRVVRGQSEVAAADLRQAIALQPARAETHNALGALLASQRQLSAAIASYRRALELRPDFAQASANLGQALAESGQPAAALEHLARAIARAAHEPMAAASALANRSGLQARAGRYAPAAADARAALALNPEQAELPGNALYFAMVQADWTDLDRHRSALLAALQAGQPAATPFVALTLTDDPDLLLRNARRYAQDHLAAADDDFQPPPPGPRIRLAWCSADFYSHATAFLMAGVLEHIDKQRFEVFAVSYGPATDDDYQRRLRASVDRFVDVRDRSDAAVGTLLRELQADIVIDLKGYTNEGRPGIFARRHAAVQLSYLAYPGTLGLPLMDYLIADSVVVPPGAESGYSEAVVRLPDSYQANDARRAIAPTRYTRRDLGLPETGFVFCSFNNTYKITPEVFDVWMRLLQQVPGSVLWLLQDNPAVADNLGREAQARGVARERLVFAPRLPMAEHLARQAAADLFLDTWPVNAHTTASDALWAGLPLVTLPGRSFAARVAASLLHAVGANDCVATDVADYESLALRLAREPDRLAALKARLQQARREAPLFDTARYTRHLEAAFEQMHARARAGLPPQSFTVDPLPRQAD